MVVLDSYFGHRYIYIKCRSSWSHSSVSMRLRSCHHKASKTRDGNEQYTIIDFNRVDMMIYLPEKVIFTEATMPR